MIEYNKEDNSEASANLKVKMKKLIIINQNNLNQKLIKNS
jgi:hypothetical protein